MDQTSMWVIGLFVALIVISLLAAMAGGRRSAGFEAACRERGWQVEPGSQGPGRRISGSAGGVSWSYEVQHTDGGSAQRGSGGRVRATRLVVESAALAEEAVLVVPYLEGADREGSLLVSNTRLSNVGRRLIAGFVGALGGSPSDAAPLERLTTAQAGSPALRERFNVLATSDDPAARLLRSGEPALLDFAADRAPGAREARRRLLVILWWRGGLAVILKRRLTSVDQLDALVALIAGLASGLKAR